MNLPIDHGLWALLKKHDRSRFLILSILEILSVVTVSLVGLLTPDFYAKESANWRAQSIGQDMADLFLVTPVLALTTYFAYRGYKRAFLIWGGVMGYLLYTFIIYAFDLHFNQLFLVYCLTLGTSFYGLLLFASVNIRTQLITEYQHRGITKTIGIYFLLIAGVFYLLWLSEILPAVIQNTTPASLTEIGLVTNPVHVIDLSVLLPGVLIAGILLLKGNRIGLTLAPALLTFFILMNLTIGGLVVVMKIKGIEADISITVIMAVLALFSLALLILYLKNIPKKPQSIHQQ